jgi:class 3 adenylate cyclase
VDLHNVLSRPPRIVIADDDWLNRDLLFTYLTAAGCEVQAFEDGVGALKAVQETLPDLVLLDNQMPEMIGLEVCRVIKQDKRTQFIPVIIVTVLGSEQDQLNANEAGADDFIPKPFNSVILLTRVRSLLRIKHLHDQLDRRNQLLSQVLKRYLAHEIADIVLADPERNLRLGGETREVTILFADLRDFSLFSTSHSAPEVVDSLNLIFNELVEIIFKYKGTFDKFMGDAIMAFFGAPIQSEDDIERALMAALEMQERFSHLKRGSPGLAPMGLGIGVHTGEVIVGNIGSERMMDYTVIGEPVNLARRLQETAKPGEILISEVIFQAMPQIIAEPLNEKIIHGQNKSVELFILKGIGIQGSLL